MNIKLETKTNSPLTLVLGATGKTGRRIIERLSALNVSVRQGSRSASPAFDWNNELGWDACLDGVTSVYINYAPDLAIPGATDSIQSFVSRAEKHGVERLILLSGRG
ncbi:MAG: NmrA family transcriptional regulator, partial [Proteobacteria bacterium]|nr:NmrA family transcriptional regulator [Pseudomonadota bacterium]